MCFGRIGVSRQPAASIRRMAGIAQTKTLSTAAMTLFSRRVSALQSTMARDNNLWQPA
jgi:hypothetical protein